MNEEATRHTTSGRSRRAEERVRDRFPDLSGSESKIVFYLHGLLKKAGSGIWMTDEKLEKATGVSVRQIRSVRQTLVRQGLIQTETVPGRGTGYTLPASPASGVIAEPATGQAGPRKSVVSKRVVRARRDALKVDRKLRPTPLSTPAAKKLPERRDAGKMAANLSSTASERAVMEQPEAKPSAPPQTAGVEKPSLERADAGEINAEPSPLPGPVEKPTLEDRDGGDMGHQPEAARRSASTPPALEAPKPVAAVPIPQATPHEEIIALMAEMMEGEKLDGAFLQKLQELTGGLDNLRECLHWMVEQYNPRLFIKHYQFPASPKGRDLFFSELHSLLHSSKSPYLKWRQASKR